MEILGCQMLRVAALLKYYKKPVKILKMNSSLSQKKLCMALGCLVLFALSLRGADQTNSQNFLAEMQGFEKLTENQRITCVDENEQYMRQLEETLFSKLGSQDQDVRFYAAFFLGVYRFPEAAGPLASVISMEDKVRPYMPRDRLWVWGHYPAMAALMRIGSPAISPVIRNLEESDDAKIRELSLEVLDYIDNDRDITSLRLRKSLAVQKDPQKRARLQLASKALETIVPGRSFLQ
jgi:hypothetical protein